MKEFKVTYTYGTTEQEYSKKIQADSKEQAEVLFETGISLWGYKVTGVEEI